MSSVTATSLRQTQGAEVTQSGQQSNITIKPAPAGKLTALENQPAAVTSEPKCPKVTATKGERCAHIPMKIHRRPRTRAP